MKYDIAVDEDKKLINTKVSGDLVSDDVIELTKAVGAVAVEHGIDHFLFDMRECTELVDMTDAFMLAANPEKRGLKRGQKRALVHSGNDDTYEFFEDVSVNRGYGVKAFTDIDKARTWLQE